MSGSLLPAVTASGPSREGASPSLAESLLRVWDETPEPVVALDTDWRYRYLNPAAMAMLDITADVLGQDYREIHPDIPGSPIEVVHRRVMRTRVMESMDTFYAPLDTYLRVRVLPWPGSGIVLSFRDATEERRPQARLRRNLDLYRQVVDSMTQAVTLRDLEGRFLLVNRAAATYIGRPAEELLGGTVEELYPPEIARAVRAVHARVLETGVAQNSPAVAQLHPERDVMSDVFPVRDDDGTMLGVVTTVTDVTELTTALADLTASQLRFRRVFASTSLGVLVMREGGEIVEANTAFCRLVGWSRSVLLGRSGADLLKRGDHRWDGEEGDEGYEVEDELVRSDGAVVPVLLTINAFEDTDGRGRMVSCVVRDLTVVHQLQAQLVSAERMQALGWLAAGIAHDANNILTAVSGYAELLREQVQALPAAQRHLDGIVRSVGRAGEMVERLAAFAGGTVAEPHTVDLGELARDLEDLLRRLLPAGVQLTTDLQPAPADLDASQIRQVLLNLVMNAGQALDGAGTIRISTGRGQGDTVFLAVADDGPGMSPDVAEHCFEPFVTTRQGSGGTGVGLSTAAHIAVQHGGALRVVTAPGDGATFELVLPAAITQEPLLVAPRPTGTVVVADDDPVVRDLMVSALTSAGYDVAGVEDGLGAVALAAGASLVVSDVDMPVLGGVELAERLGARQPAVPVLLVSGAVHPELDPRVPFLAKPFTSEELVAAVDRALVVPP